MKSFSKFILRRAGWVAFIGTLIAFIGGFYSVQLYKNLRTNFEELLPTNARSVLDINEVTKRLQSIDNIAILIFSQDTKNSKRFVVDLANRIKKLPPDVATS